MSYTIVYVRQFLRLPDGRYIPLCLLGCSNVTEPWNHNRRARDWDSLSGRPNQLDFALTPAALMDYCRSWTGGAYEDHFKYRGKWVNDAMLVRFAENGMKEAKTLEELREEHPSLYLTCRLSVWTDGDGEKPHGDHHMESFAAIHSSERLIEYLETAQERIRGKAENERIYISMEYPSEYQLYRKRRRPPVRLEDNYYVLYINSRCGYVQKVTARHLFFTYYFDSAKQFKTVREAQKWVDKYLPRFKSLFDVEVKHILNQDGQQAA